MVKKERKEEDKAKDMATASTKKEEEEATKEERKEKAEEEEEVTKEDSRAKAEDLEVEHPMLVYVIIATGWSLRSQLQTEAKRHAKRQHQASTAR